MLSKISPRLLTCTAIATIMVFAPNPVSAADVSAALEAGGTVNIDGTDTFVIDAVNDGAPAVSVVFTNDATNGADSLTITSDGNDADDTGQIGDLTVLDNNGTNTLTLGGAADNGPLELRIKGDVNGNVATDANDLRIIVDATAVNAASSSVLVFEQSADLGSGSITLTGDADDTAQLTFSHAVNEVITGNILSTLDDVGSRVVVQSAGGTVTVNGDIGQAGAGIANFLIGNQGGSAGNISVAGNVDADNIHIDGDSGVSVGDFNGNVTGNTITVEGGANAGEWAYAYFAGDVNVTSITVDSETEAGIITFDGSSAQSITGVIQAATAGEGNMIVDTGADVTFNSTVGVGASALDNLTVRSGATATFTQNVGITQDGPGDIGINSDGTFVINTAGNTVSVSESTGDIDFDGTLRVIGADNATISAASDLFIDGTFSSILSGTAKTLSLTGTNSLAIGASSDTTITAGNQIVLGSNTTIGGGATSTVLNVRKTDDFNPDATAVIDATGRVVTIAGPLSVGIDTAGSAFNFGDTVTVIDSDQNAATSYATLVGNGTITFRDTAVLDLEDDGSDAQDLKFAVQIKDDVDGISGDKEDVLKKAFQETSGGTDPEVFGAIAGLGANDTDDAALQLTADTTGGEAIGRATSGNMMAGFDMISARLSDLRQGKGQTGVSSGNAYLDRHVWLRGFGLTADQDMRDGVQGYEADTVGAMAGMDVLLENDIRLGVNGSYAVTDVDTDGAGNHKTDIDTYRIGAYGGKDFDRYYVEGQISFAYNDIDTSRTITFGGLNRTAAGDTEGYEYGARIGAGMPMAFEGGRTITPHVNFQYIHASVDKYTETGAGSLNTTVDNDDIDVAELAVGAKYDADYKYDGGIFTPELRVSAAYDFIGDTSVSTQTFTGGGATSRVRGADPAQFSVNYGAGIRWETADDMWELSLDYDGKAKSDYISHGARIEAKLRF